MTYSSIPNTIREHKAFLVWKFEQMEDRKKPLKVPMYTNGKWRKGSQGTREDRQQLVPYDTAISVLNKSKKHYSGLGMALLTDWGLVAVDFDDCVINGKLNDDVYSLVEPTYWEFSPSGNGIRAFFNGHLRDGKSISAKAKEADGGRDWGVEFFCSKGFVTLTGNVAPEVEMVGPNDIIPLTKEIKDLHSRTIGSRSASTDNKEQAAVGMTDAEIKKMLESWEPDSDYDTWMNIGMALHHETDGEGFDLWNEWSSQGSDYPGVDQCQYKWESFGRSGKKSLKTVRWMINEKGLDFELEAGTDEGEFKPLGPLVDKKTGKEVKSIPRLEMDGKGVALATMSNVVSWLTRPDMTGWELGYDLFKDEAMWQPHGAVMEWRRFTDADYTRLRVHFDRRNFKPVSKDMMRDAVGLVAEENAFDSATLWLESLEWDGVPRVATFLSRYLGAEDTEYTRAVALYAWTAHAGRILDAGCKADMLPVLVGAQGCGKSTCIEAIAPVKEEHFMEFNFTDKSDDNARRMRGRLVVECAELQGLGGRETEMVKATITRTHEDWVPKYKEFSTAYPRRFVFWGSSNTDDFLSDSTGNRRWLPVRVGGGDAAAVRVDRNQLWAEARELWEILGVEFSAAERLAKDVHEEFTNVDPWEELVVNFFESNNESGNRWGDLEVVASDDIYIEALGLMPGSRNNFTRTRLRNVMTRLKYKYGQQRDSQGARPRGFWKQK